jgi:hypothetical protein
MSAIRANLFMSIPGIEPTSYTAVFFVNTEPLSAFS